LVGLFFISEIDGALPKRDNECFDSGAYCCGSFVVVVTPKKAVRIPNAEEDMRSANLHLNFDLLAIHGDYRMPRVTGTRDSGRGEC
jgi:hypothetical protein